MNFDDDDVRGAPRHQERREKDRTLNVRPHAPQYPTPQEPTAGPPERVATKGDGELDSGDHNHAPHDRSVEDQLAITVANLEFLCDTIRNSQRRQDQHLKLSVRETMVACFDALLESNRTEMKTAFHETTKEAGMRLSTELSKAIGDAVRTAVQDPSDKWRAASDQLTELKTRLDSLEKAFERILNKVVYAGLGMSIIYTVGIILAMSGYLR